ncbi:uncharacterized protein LOC142566144 [Dermacentor variabilis]|uniref:uncharacterized protein LOC142566144 n=1 Tax=Dermacentor variabilis TaxID=34621 RepID=UPI003F5C0E5E
MSKHNRCSVIGCKPSDRPGPGPFRHRLPVHEAQRLAWLQCIGLPPTQKYARVCRRHFAPEDYIHDPRVQQEMSTVLRPVLRPGALPTLFVPNRVPVPAPWSSASKASQTYETRTCRRELLRCTASTQTTQDECSLPATSKAGTQTATILCTVATQTQQHHISGRNAGLGKGKKKGKEREAS